LESRKGDFSKEEFLPDGKESQTYIFRDVFDEEGFPKVFSLRVQEVRMFLRIVHFYTSTLVWEERIQRVGPLELLLGLQFIEWFENLSVSSSLLTKELHLVYSIWNSIFESKDLSLRENQSFNRSELQKEISLNQESLGHLTFRHWRSECKRDTFLNYISSHLISTRELQRRNLNHQSHFKRSSDHSNSTRGNTSFGKIPIPRTKEFSSSELQWFLELTPHERKVQLMGESSKT